MDKSREEPNWGQQLWADITDAWLLVLISGIGLVSTLGAGSKLGFVWCFVASIVAFWAHRDRKRAARAIEKSSVMLRQSQAYITLLENDNCKLLAELINQEKRHREDHNDNAAPR